MTIPSSPIPTARPLTAAALIVAAMAILGLSDNLVVLVTHDTGLWQFHAVRSGVAIPMILGVAMVYRLRLRPKRLIAVALRSVLIATAMFCYFGALAFVPVAQSAAGLFMAPIWVLVLALAGRGQNVGPLNILAVIGGFGGALLVLQPNVSELSPALVMPIAAGVLYALGAIATRKYCAEESTLALLSGFFLSIMGIGALGCVGLAIVNPTVPDGAAGFLLRGWMPLSGSVLGWIALQSFCAVIGVGLITKGYLLAEAAFVSVFEYTLLIFGALWGWLLWTQALNIWAALGIALIIASGTVLARSERSTPA